MKRPRKIPPEDIRRSKEATDFLLGELAEFEPFIYAVSADGLSRYVHFRKLPANCTHKLRISNHNERKRYGYMWQLRLDDGPIREKKYSKFFHSEFELVKAFKKYYKAVAHYEREREPIIPDRFPTDKPKPPRVFPDDCPF